MSQSTIRIAFVDVQRDLSRNTIAMVLPLSWKAWARLALFSK
jgi:hypothetical protein